MDWIDKIYVATKHFPSDERFGLTSQLRRSSVSVAANISEGMGRTSNKDFLRFVEISYGSFMEAVCECMIAKRQNYISEEQLKSLYSDAEELARMLSGLRSSLLKKE